MLLEHGADTNSSDGKVESALSAAVQSDDSDILAWLLGNGADPTWMRLDVLDASSYIYDLAARAHKDVALLFLMNYQPTLSRHYALRAVVKCGRDDMLHDILRK
jgi:hypothetical protein